MWFPAWSLFRFLLVCRTSLILQRCHQRQQMTNAGSVCSGCGSSSAPRVLFGSFPSQAGISQPSLCEACEMIANSRIRTESYVADGQLYMQIFSVSRLPSCGCDLLSSQVIQTFCSHSVSMVWLYAIISAEHVWFFRLFCSWYICQCYSVQQRWRLRLRALSMHMSADTRAVFYPVRACVNRWTACLFLCVFPLQSLTGCSAAISYNTRRRGVIAA